MQQIVDTERYPLDDPDGPLWRQAVEAAREDLAGDGCTVLRDFVRPDLVETLRVQGTEIAPQAYYDVETVNVYNTEPDDRLPADHPARLTMQRGNAFVPRDRIGADLIIHRLYASAAFRRFVGHCFGLPEVYELADPLAGLTLNVVTPGRSHPWHFDTNEFAVSMLTQAPEDGGVFEYCPNIRSTGAENFDDVRAVLDGRGEHLVKRLRLRPGDLQLFRGRYALHRVTTVLGDTPRHSAIFAFSERPGVIGSLARTRQLFGRVTAEHEAAAQRVRVDELLD